ncbi:MAG: hypothetical protein EXS03_01710 [Phycisphaerales bacterium]|nr:hypothetical protein [Phycisphaerales bacterium]
MTEPAAATTPSQGSIFHGTDESQLRSALDEAFSYRGDVTITTKAGRRVDGYLFDRRLGSSLADSSVRILTATSEIRVTIAYSEIDSLEFSGRDTAQGKSWETWVRRYAQKKLAGQAASIEPDSGE